MYQRLYECHLLQSYIMTEILKLWVNKVTSNFKGVTQFPKII
jgi:hypothetical protein